MSGYYGVVLFSGELRPVETSKVRDAMLAAELDPEIVREIRPRSGFIRAVRKLKRDGVIASEGSEGVLLHKFRDDDTQIEFQFSKTFLETHGVRYDSAAVVSFNKATHEISCLNEEVKALALNLYNQLQKVYSVQDIQSLVRRVIEKSGARRIPLRDGVYFLSYSHFSLAQRLKKFYTLLGSSCFSFLATEETQDRAELVKAVIQDIKRNVEALNAEVAGLKLENKLTSLTAKNRIKQAHADIAAYQDLAVTLKTNLSDLITQSGEAGVALYSLGVDDTDALISKIQRGGVVSALAYDLASASEPEIFTAMPRPRFAQADIVEEPIVKGA